MVRNLIYSLFVAIVFLYGVPAYAAMLEDESSAAVYAYFNVTENGEDSSLSYDLFVQQIDEIGIGNYTVLSLSDLLLKEDKGEELAPNTIAITFDEPDAGTYARAIPLLVDRKIPFTIFISPGNADDVEWETLNNLSGNDFVTIGLSSHTYGRLGDWSEAKIREDINKAKSIYREKLGRDAQFFAYPLGQYSEAFLSAVRQQGFVAAFGQNSGVVTKSLDRMKLPRFTMTEEFGDLERFRTTSNAMPFPVTDIQPATSYMASLPAIGFTIDKQIGETEMKKTKCFSSGPAQPETLYLGSGRVEVRFAEPPSTDRLRINCTIPVPGEIADDDPRYRWLGLLLYFPVAPAQPETDISPVQP